MVFNTKIYHPPQLIAAFSAEVLAKKLERSPAGSFSRLWIKAWPWITDKAMTGTVIDIDRNIRLGRADQLDIFQGNTLVFGTEMQLDRTACLELEILVNAAAVLTRRRIKAAFDTKGQQSRRFAIRIFLCQFIIR